MPMIDFLKAQWLFLRELRNNPGAIGAVFPSSRKLGRVMGAQIPADTKGLIVELGAGTGSITKALRKRFPDEKLIIVERSKNMCKYLKKRFPSVNIVLGDAIDLHDLLAAFDKPVDAIVSSLPLRSLDKAIINKIEEAAFNSLSVNGVFIQFTYDPRDNAADILPRFEYLYRKKVWCNVPPAKVDVYKKCR